VTNPGGMEDRERLPPGMASSRGIQVGLAVRRTVMTVFAAVVVVALSGAIGQPQKGSTAQSAVATLHVSAPERVRGGLFFQARVDVRATRPIAAPRLILTDGWLEGMQVNSIEPAAESESSRDGRLELSYPKVAAGERMRIYLQFEVNPTNVGHRSQDLELDDGTTRLARVERSITVLP
jgi:hypothetical protein